MFIFINLYIGLHSTSSILTYYVLFFVICAKAKRITKNLVIPEADLNHNDISIRDFKSLCLPIPPLGLVLFFTPLLNYILCFAHTLGQ